MKKTSLRDKSWLRHAVIALVLVGVVVAIFLLRDRMHFDWANLKLQMRAVDWRLVAAAFTAIWISMIFRAVRWRLLLGSVSSTSALKLIPSQLIGFTVVALFGRVADLARPYLVARKTATPVATQLAVYSIERAFDLAAAAILFSTTFVLVPRTTPHFAQFERAGLGALGLTAFITFFALAVRFAGATLASMARNLFKLISDDFAKDAATKILDFRDGMKSISTAGQFLGSLTWSLVIWILIASSYLLTARAFRSSAELATFTVSATMLLMATSMGGSLFQLPVLGWFTQIGVLAGALHVFFGVPLEVASACGRRAVSGNDALRHPAGPHRRKDRGDQLACALLPTVLRPWPSR